MAVHALDNASWGFASSCFVCEPSNAHGLRIPFFHDDEAHVVRATFTLDERYSGAPRFVHGGILLAVMDEAMAWATIAIGERFAVTTETTTRFHGPVRVGRAYEVRARVDNATDLTLATTAEIVDANDRARASAQATFSVLTAQAAARAIGSADPEHDRFLRGGDAGPAAAPAP